MLLPQELIRKKRDGVALEPSELRAFITGVTDGSIPDYQVAAMLMAIVFRGMTDEELAVWADAMVLSGDVLDLSSVERPKIDKHSTGGVGDKISLPLAPAVAACGVAVPMISGRGLGHTGGTLDKLESIPGFRVNLEVDQFIAQVGELGTALIGQTDRLAPADRRLYAMRDVTATVESVPLIASSIMSKKLAEGIDGLVLDCKIGNGAFMRTREEATELARAIRVIGEAAGKRISVALTSMDSPIGRMVGNALEVYESIEVLRGGGPPDTHDLTVRLGAEMLLLAGVCSEGREAAERIDTVLADGSALEIFRRLVAAQGGDPRVADEPAAVLPHATEKTALEAGMAGYITSIAARDVGIAALMLGAGRLRTDDNIDPAVGIELLATVGDQVEQGQPLAYIHHNGNGLEECLAKLGGAYSIGEEAPMVGSRVLEVLR